MSQRHVLLRNSGQHQALLLPDPSRWVTGSVCSDLSSPQLYICQFFRKDFLDLLIQRHPSPLHPGRSFSLKPASFLMWGMISRLWVSVSGQFLPLEVEDTCKGRGRPCWLHHAISRALRSGPCRCSRQRVTVLFPSVFSFTHQGEHNHPSSLLLRS